MPRPLGLLVHAIVLLAAWRWTRSTSGFLVIGGGLCLLLDRYALRVLRSPAIAWRTELMRRGGTWCAGAAGFACMRPGLVPPIEAAHRGMMVCLTAVLLEQTARIASGRRALMLRGPAFGLLIAMIPVVVGLHPLHTVPKRTPASWGFAFEDVRFRTTDGIQLAAWVVPHAQPRGNVIFCHGHGRNRGHVAGHLQTLHDLGLNVLAFDFRGHGDSEGHTSTFGVREVEDLRAAVAYMAERFPDQPLVIVGISLGAAVTLQALPQLPGVVGVWSEAAFARLTSAVNQGLSPVPEPLRGPLIESTFLLGVAVYCMRMEERARFWLLGAIASEAAFSPARGGSTERNTVPPGYRALAGGCCLRTWFREELIQYGRCQFTRRQPELLE